MASPVIQFKRGAFTNLPGLRAGEPALTTDTFDLYVGIDSTTNNNKFFGSHRYWTKETSSTGSSINLVEGTSNGTSYVSLKSPDSLSGIVTYTLPGTINDGYFLKVASNGTLSWENVTGSGASFSDATLSGITTIDGSLNVTATSNFIGISTFSNVDINGGSIDGTTIGASTPSDGYFTLVDTNVLASDNSTIGFATATNFYIDATRVLYDDGSGITLAGIQTIDATTRQTLESLLALEPNDFTSLNVSGISTFQGNVNIGNASSDTLTVASTATFLEPVVGTISTATKLQNARDFSITGNFVTATAISFDGTGNVALAATIAPNSVTLGTYTSGDYVANITSGDGLTGGATGEGTTPTLAVGVGTGIAVNADTVSLKNTENLTNDTVLGWNSASGQLEVAPITYSGNLTLNSPTNTTVIDDNLEVYGNINCTGNVSVGGTTITLRGNEVLIENKDIILGYTTSITPNDDTANHAGVAIASTEGSPLASFTASGINTLPDTYKQMMWFKSGTLGFSTDAFAFNYGVAIGTTTMASGVRLAVGPNVTVTDTTITAPVGNFGILSGSLTGTISTATRSTTIDTTATSTAAEFYPTFVSASTSATGATLRVDGGVSYNPDTDTLTVPNIKSAAIKASDGTPAITINNTTGNVSVASSLTVTGDLTVLGSQTIVNTTELKVEDNLIDLGLVNSSGSLIPPTSDSNLDIGVLFNYYTTSAKKSGIFWDDSTGRIGIASDLTVTNGVVDTISTVWAPIEIGSLWLNDCAGQSQVINCAAGIRTLENITVDGGSF